MLAALADGESRLAGLLDGADPRSTAAALRSLGVLVPDPPQDGAPVAVTGVGLRGLRAPDGTIDCGNSGTTARLLMGILAGQGFAAELTGDASLRTRPMRRVTDPLERMGVRVEERGEPGCLPLRLTGGRLNGITHASPKASAQVKSAVLLAGLTGGVGVRVVEPYPSRDHTERMLAAMDVPVRTGTVDEGHEVVLEPVPRLRPLDFQVPGDISSAAYFVVLGLAGTAGPLRIRGVGLNPTRSGMLDVVRRMGGSVTVEAVTDSGGEPVGDLVVERSSLGATTVAAAEIPSLLDEVPALAALAARADGETRFTGADELRVKESDRLAALAEGLRAVGVQAEDDAGTLTVVGTDRPLRGRASSHGDHRIAMAFGVLGALPGNDIQVGEPGVVSVSYPAFWADLERTAAALA